MNKPVEVAQIETQSALVVVKRAVGRPKGVKNGEGKPVEIREKKTGYGFGGSTPDAVKRGQTAKANKPWRDALNRALAQADGKTLRKLADALIKKAAEGDVQALKEIGDRIDGKSVQQVEQKMDATIRVRAEDADL